MDHHPFQKITHIQTKLMLIFFCTIVIPLIFFGSFLLSQQIITTENEASSSAQRELIQMAEKMSLEFSQIQSISNLFYLDSDLSNFLGDYNNSERKVAKNIHDIDHIVTKYNSGVNNVYFQVAIVALDGKVMGNPMFLNKTPIIQLSEMPWFASIRKTQTNIIWTKDSKLDTLFSSPGYPYVYVVRDLHNLSTGARIGTLIIGISENEIRKMYSSYVSDAQSTCILNENDEIVSQIDNQQLGIESLLPFENLRNYSGTFHYGSGDNKQLVTFYTINSTQWKIVTYYNMGVLLQSFDSVRSVFLSIMSLYLIATIILSYVLAKHFVVPINNLYSHMAKVKTGDLDAYVTITSNDEIAELSEQFNEMIAKIHELMTSVMTEQKLKREAEILSLQTQINPHFLYNTLASIRFMVYTGNKEDADTIILALIHIMKNTLSDINEFVTVEKEVDLLRDYIDIQKLTFASPPTVHFDIDENINGCKIIKLLLQPIVENAILHGLKPKKSDCILTITGRAVDEILEFKIVDNGVGFDISKSNLNFQNRDFKNGVGLRNVHNRIVLTFGEEYGITVVSCINQGTAVTVRIPKILSEGDYSSYEHLDS